MYEHRKLCQIVEKEIIVEESALNIFYTDSIPKNEWKPEVSLKPYNELTKVVLDIETTGLDKECDRIIAIGCMRESGNTQIFMQSDEALLLQEFLDYLQSVNPESLEINQLRSEICHPDWLNFNYTKIPASPEALMVGITSAMTPPWVKEVA